MEAFERQMKALRRRFENQEKELEDFLALSPVDLRAVEARNAILEDLQGQTRTCAEKLVEQMTIEGRADEDINREHDLIDSYSYRFELLRLKVRDALKIEEDKTQSIKTGSVSGETRRGFKLPQVEIKKFDGTRTEWLGFWAQFERIHEDQEIPNSDKFWYLLNSLKAGSEALELASLYPQSAENYPKVIEALRKRYGNEDTLLQVYIRELLSLVIANVSSKDKLPLHSLFMKVDSHLRSLRTLKLQNADPETWLYPLVESCLPERVLYNWQRSPMSSVDSRYEDPPKSRLDLLLQFVEKEIDIQQSIELARSFSHETIKGANSKSHKKDVTEKDLRKPATVSSFHTRDKPACSFCERTNHESGRCLKAMKMTQFELKDILRKKSLCFICFKPNHTAHECRNKVKCDICKFPHSTSSCPKSVSVRKDNPKERRDSQEEPPKKKQKPSETVVVQSLASVSQNVNSTVNSQTLIVKICNGNKTENVRVFLDTGSKRSYITKRLAKKLDLVPFPFHLGSMPLNGLFILSLEEFKQNQHCIRNTALRFEL